MERKEAFLAGFHPRLGANSSIKRAADTGLFDPNLVNMIFQFDQPSQVVIAVEPEEPDEPEQRKESLLYALFNVILFIPAFTTASFSECFELWGYVFCATLIYSAIGFLWKSGIHSSLRFLPVPPPRYPLSTHVKADVLMKLIMWFWGTFEWFIDDCDRKDPGGVFFCVFCAAFFVFFFVCCKCPE